jgi:hypothetical protein
MATDPVFFISYARLDAEYPEFRNDLQKFIADLEAEVAMALARPRRGVSFMDEHIQAGEVWTDRLGESLMRCRVGVALYSPGYFTRRWCGQEF